MTKHQTQFGHIYGYGLFTLWATVSAFIVGAQIVSYWPNVLDALFLSISSVFLTMIFALPVAALLTLIIGGAVWAILKQTSLTNSLRAMIAGAFSGSLVIFPFLISDILNGQLEALGFVLLIGALGVWCGWLGERLARRHVDLNPTNIADSFD